eukprot:TRINITY_DN5660_c0_g1_i1.p1 TRINITY_DN5660_c0_g1~~TRINITY_DN5660_c0_g1_i1.p1  ORF type:complete len:596 (+),score=190.67 TRINITY_DN5660_c0_g1_i1:68-1855(+)
MFRNSKRSSVYKGSKGEYAQRDVTVHRNSQNVFGLKIEGGIENDLIPRIADIGSTSKVTGKLANGDLILAIDGTVVAGEPHNVVQDFMKNAGDSVRLTVCSPKDPQSAQASHLAKLKEDMDADTAKLQDQVKKRMYDMAARFTTRPRSANEMQSREFNFVTPAEFERLQAADRFIEASKAEDGYWYGTIKPNKELAQPEQRLRRRQILEGTVTDEPSTATANGNGQPRDVAVSGAAAGNGTPRVEVTEESTPAAGDGADDQVQTVVLARKNGKLNFTFDGGIEYGVLLTIKSVDDVDMISSTSRALEVGDCILAVNGVSVAGCTVQEAQDMIKKLDDPVELTTTCIPTSDYINLADFIKVKPGDSEAIKRAKEDVKRDVYSQTVPYTTRAPREGEEDGKKYNFVTREVFEKMKADGKFLEWGEFDGVLYGTPKRTPKEQTSHFRRSQSSIYVRGKKIFRPSLVTIHRNAGQPLGMELISAEGKTYIKDVDQDSPAFNSKLRPGMLVTSIAEKDIENTDFEEVKQLIAQQGETFQIRVKYDPKGHEEALQFARAEPVPEPTKEKSSSNWVITSASAAAVVGLAAMAYQFLDMDQLF